MEKSGGAMGGLSRCEHPGWRPTLFVPPTEGKPCTAADTHQAGRRDGGIADRPGRGRRPTTMTPPERPGDSDEYGNYLTARRTRTRDRDGRADRQRPGARAAD